MRNSVLTAVMLFFSVFGHARASEKLTQVNFANGVATIDLFIELHGSASSPALAQRWEQLVEQTWNEALAEHGCSCFVIRLDAHFQHRDGATPTPGWESWEVQSRADWESGNPDWTPSVTLPSTTLENSDRFEGDSGSGEMATNEPWVVIHEIAHLFGHDDRYSFPPGWRKGDPIQPDAGWEGNLMSGPKITAEQWANAPEQYFSAKNYEEIQRAVLDYLQEHKQEAPRAVIEMEIDLDFVQNGYGPAGPTAAKNSDQGVSSMELCILFFESGGTSTTGSGVLQWSPRERVPETHFGGQQTINNPYPVEVTGRVQYDSGFDSYFVTLTPQDIVNYRLTGGQVYASGSHLSWIFPHTQFQNPWIQGSLQSFELSPMAINFGDTMFPLTIETPINQNVQSLGTGTVRVLHSVLLPAPAE